ncbi:MAG: DotU family type IV/VI secretion system protein [Bryobacteraceae bacterium]
MNGDPAEEKDVAQRLESRRPSDHLALLYEGILTAIVRVQSGRQQIQGSDSFRTKMKSALDEIGRAAAQRGYTAEHVKEANFAIIAFLDEAVLTSNDGGRTQWARKTLQEEMFNQRSAGELFFQHLDQLRAHRDSPQLAQVLEVYYLCLLLGYEGKYAVGSKAELHLLMDNLRERVERISGRVVEFSPDAQLPPQSPAPVHVDPLPRRIRILALAAAAFALLCFVCFKFYLSLQTGELHSVVREVSRPWM